MAGKRLLDAAKLLEAARGIGQQHVIIRQQQWDVYRKTSTLAKAVKNQTDRITVTANAAYELTKRLNEEGPRWQTPVESERDRRKSSDDDEISVQTSQAVDSRSLDQTPRNDALKTTILKDEVHDLHEQLAVTQSEPRHTLEQFTAPQDDGSKQEDVPEGVNLDGLFSSQRVSRSVGKTGPNIQNPFGSRKKMAPRPLPEMIAAQEQRQHSPTAVSTTVTNEKTQSSSPPPVTTIKSAKVQSADQQPSGVRNAEMANGDADAETQEIAEAISRETSSPPNADASTVQENEMHESRVPSTRFGRLWQYGGLATSMAFGAVGESFRRFTGGASEGSVMMSEANMNRLVAKLSRMRGAALKLGQMVSFQDSKMLPPAINAVLQRVQDSADYMPPSQRDKVLRDNLGEDWRSLFSDFSERPFAAASIGQVHKATLASNGKPVAVKIQYPGVRDSIDSDLNNLSMLLTASRLLPRGLFLDKTIANARVELGWECDYEREARAAKRFKELLREESDVFHVPEIYEEASGPGVLTAEFVPGSAVTKMKDLSQEDRDWVGTQILRLCLRELMEWRFMQTDPNWTNFLYNRETKKLELLDFGASREFPDAFVEPYVSLLIAASEGDRERCRQLSINLGYLTGDEGPEMVKAHVDSIMTLAEPFVETAPEVYSFEDQTITDRVRANIGLMLRERLAPPPEETYSLHRKLSGSFLLCARLQSRVRARDMFANAVRVWEGREAAI